MHSPTVRNLDLGPIRQRPLNRRKIRKGTTSCWECKKLHGHICLFTYVRYSHHRTGKRRKTRCYFSSPQSNTCVPCERRGKTCLTQEYNDPGPGPISEYHRARERTEQHDFSGSCDELVDALAENAAVGSTSTSASPPGRTAFSSNRCSSRPISIHFWDSSLVGYSSFTLRMDPLLTQINA